MPEYAAPTNTSNPIMNPVIYWRVSAWTLAATAVLGIVMSAVNDGEFIDGFLNFDWTHNIVHVVLAAAAFLFGYANLPGSTAKTFAIIFGFVYGGLGAFGLFVDEVGPMHLEMGENLIHLLLGAWGLVAGFGSKA